jgi:hypothetical protein
MPDSNLEQLIQAAQLRRPLLGELVFVGGSVAGLLITDEAAGDPRATIDVDAIAEITSGGIRGGHDRRSAAMPAGPSADDTRRHAAR